jgi:hypothetical protein
MQRNFCKDIFATKALQRFVGTPGDDLVTVIMHVVNAPTRGKAVIMHFVNAAATSRRP